MRARRSGFFYSRENRARWCSFFVLASFSVLIMVTDHFSHSLEKMRYSLAVPLHSVQYFAGLPRNLFYELRNTVRSHHSLIQENKALQTEELLLRGQLQRLQAIEAENRDLRALLRASTKVRGRMLVARLLPVEPDSFIYRPLLDQGKHQGIYVGQPVLDAFGVMGQIVRVNAASSQLLPITDPQSGVPIEVVRNGLRAIAVGDALSQDLQLVHVPQTADIHEGDLLVTSGTGRNYPEGYPVGVVASVKADPGYQFASIRVSPLAHMDRSREVLLVWPDVEQKTPQPVETLGKNVEKKAMGINLLDNNGHKKYGHG